MAASSDDRNEGNPEPIIPNCRAAGEDEGLVVFAPGSEDAVVSKQSRPNLKPHLTECSNHMPGKAFLRFEDEAEGDDAQHWGSRFVMLEKNPVRLFWSLVLCILLAYTATIFLYRLTFCTFHISSVGLDPIGEDDVVWSVIDDIVDALFWADLGITFFISYKDPRGREVDNLAFIARKYMMFYFWINLLACLPDEVFSSIIIATSNEKGTSNPLDVRFARVYRLQRISRLARLARVTRLIKLAHIMSTSHVWKKFQALRGVRVVNFIVGLFWALHLLACGWYLCAALHVDVKQTWVASRTVDNDGTSLLDQSPFEQWLVSMYFVLTVFTTVGFGDISAGTEAEILYVALTMLVGAVVHSIIISEVIGIVTSTDAVQKVIDQQMLLIDAYTAHTQLEEETAKQMKSEITWRARNWAISHGFDKKEMKDMITGKNMPRWLIAKMPKTIFQGKLIRNDFLRSVSNVPPRLPCLLAMHLVSGDFFQDEIVYQMGDFPFNIFLVLSGTFAFVARPSPNGGIDAVELEEMKMAVMEGVWSSKNLMGKARHSRSPWDQALPKSIEEAELMGDAKDTRLSPYRLFSFGSYFGDTEMLLGKPRFSTVRCVRKGVGLTLHKSDFQDIKDMFPQFASCWASHARRRERYRRECLANLTEGMPYRCLAARRIQQFYRRSKNVGVQASAGQHESKLQEVSTRSNYSTAHQHGHAWEVATMGSVDGLRKEVLALRKEIRQLLKEQGKTPISEEGDTVCL